MTLFVVPVLYDLFNGKNMKAREIEMMKEAAGMKREGFDDDAPALPGSGAAARAEAPEPDDPKPAEETDPEPPRKSRRVKVKL